MSGPRFGLARTTAATITDDTLAVHSHDSAIYLTRLGLGVSRVDSGASIDYRVHDLAFSHRPISLATDPRGRVWLVTEDGGGVLYNGERFSRLSLGSDEVTPLMFWSRGTVAAAVGRVGNNTLRVFRLEGQTWRQVTERPIDTRGPGVVDVKFFAVDERGRFWAGIRVENNGRTRELGVAVIDESQPAATQFHSQVAPTGAEQGAVPAPDDLTAIDFTQNGAAWFAGLSGATRIQLNATAGQPADVQVFNESRGLRGDLVSDLVRGTNNRLFLATPEGLGHYDGDTFAFDLEGSSSAARVMALAVDVNGTLWGAGPRGAWSYDGTRFRPWGRGQGIPADAFTDLAVDGENRVWFVTSEGISILSQRATNVVDVVDELSGAAAPSAAPSAGN